MSVHDNCTVICLSSFEHELFAKCRRIFEPFFWNQANTIYDIKKSRKIVLLTAVSSKEKLFLINISIKDLNLLFVRPCGRYFLIFIISREPGISRNIFFPGNSKTRKSPINAVVCHNLWKIINIRWKKLLIGRGISVYNLNEVFFSFQSF